MQILHKLIFTNIFVVILRNKVTKLFSFSVQITNKLGGIENAA